MFNNVLSIKNNITKAYTFFTGYIIFIRDKIMSTKHSQKKNIVKKIKLDEINEDVSKVAEFKRCAILKFCNENCIEKNQLDILSFLNEVQNLGMWYCFFTSITSISLKFYDFFMY